MFFAIGRMYSSGSGIVANGKIDLANGDYKLDKLVALDGEWEFYWDQLLTPADFAGDKLPQVDSLM